MRHPCGRAHDTSRNTAAHSGERQRRPGPTPAKTALVQNPFGFKTLIGSAGVFGADARSCLARCRRLS